MPRFLALALALALALVGVLVAGAIGEAAFAQSAPAERRGTVSPARKAPPAKSPAPARAAPKDGTVVNDYQQCLALVERDPAAAAKAAEAWFKAAGGAAARHCTALALSAQGEHAAAGVILEALARDEAGIPERTRAEIYAQAASSWLLLEEAGRAESMLDRALKLVPGDAELLVQRAEARAAGGRDWEALDDLNTVLDRNPDQPWVLVFRAAAFRRVGSLDLAKDDLARALALEPENADAHLERGNLRQVEGDLAGAFRDWLAVLRIESEGGLAEIARRNIRALEQQGVPRPK